MSEDKKFMDIMSKISSQDVDTVTEKEKTYQGSWKKRGGVGAFMMVARKWDRLENIVRRVDWDIFAAIPNVHSKDDNSTIEQIRDLRRYLLLIETEMMCRHPLPNRPSTFEPGTPEDGGHHATEEEFEEETKYPINATNAEFKGFLGKSVRINGRSVPVRRLYNKTPNSNGRYMMHELYRRNYGN